MARNTASKPTREVTCIGGAAINHKYHANSALMQGTSNPGASVQSMGGVARNVAETLARLGTQVALVSAIGNDAAGRQIAQCMGALGVAMENTATVPGATTAQYAAIFDSAGDLFTAIAAMDVLDQIGADTIQAAGPTLAASRWVFAECNLPADTLVSLFHGKTQAGFQLAIDTVSLAKATRLPSDLSAIDVLFTNRHEASALVGKDDPFEAIEAIRARGTKSIVLTDGANGHWVADGDDLFHTPAASVALLDVSGAGDALIAGTLHGLLTCMPLVEAARYGAVLASLTIETDSDVVPNIDPDLFLAHAYRLSQLLPKRVLR